MKGNEAGKSYRNVYFFYIVCIFFTVFDGVRGVQSPSYFPFSFLRDFFLFMLFIMSFSLIDKVKYTKEFLVLFLSQIAILIYTLVTSILVANNTVYVRSSAVMIQYQEYGAGLGVWAKSLTFVLLTFSSYYLAKRMGKEFVLKTIKWVVYATFLYSLITIVIFVCFPQLAIKLSYWGGRLSLGYPTEDVCVLALSLIFLYYIKIPLSFKVLFFITNLVGLLFQNTLTGFLLLSYVLFFYFIKGRIPTKIIVIVFLLVMFIGGAIVYNNSEQFADFGALLHNKINSVLYPDSLNNDPSFYLRIQQKDMMLQTLLTEPLFLLFGYGGVGGMAVESGFYSVFGFAGAIGVAIYGFSILFFIAKSIIKKNLFLFSLVSVYCISAISIAPLYLMSTYWLFSFIIIFSSLFLVKKELF